jgi:hypothetical protein
MIVTTVSIYLTATSWGNVDLAGLYLFRSPTNADNTVLVLLAGPYAQVISPPFFDPKARYEFKIDSTEDFKPDLTFRIRFSPPDSLGFQTFKLQKMIGRKRTHEFLPAGCPVFPDRQSQRVWHVH